MYKLLKAGVSRLADSAIIPADPGNRDYAEFLRWCSAGNIPEPLVTDEEFAAIVLAENLAFEAKWVVSELAFIFDQLLRIEDSDPTALPGTAEQWRAYRVQVRAHVSPETSDRPTRPE